MPFSESHLPLIGFSTGALALADWERGLLQCRELGLSAVELSALRLSEFQPLVQVACGLDFADFEYVSVHVPSRYRPEDERKVLLTAESAAARGWPLILHPDTIVDWGGWREFGARVCIENMDKRKPIGRTVEELQEAFEQLPDARFCFDFGHARQVDPTMTQARRLLAAFGDRLHQIHFSEVDSANRHRLLNHSALRAFGQIRTPAMAHLPIILETPAANDEARFQIELASKFFADAGMFTSAAA